MKVYEKIRNLRERNRFSQEEMALKLNMSPNGYAKIERGETKLTLPRLEQIAEILDVDIFELMTDGRKFVYQVNTDGNNNSDVSFHQAHENSSEIEKLKLIIQHKEELLLQQQREIDHLHKLINLLEASKNNL